MKSKSMKVDGLQSECAVQLHYGAKANRGDAMTMAVMCARQNNSTTTKTAPVRRRQRLTQPVCCIFMGPEWLRRDPGSATQP